MIRAMHCLLALLLLTTPALSLAESQSPLGIRVERSLEQTQSAATATVSLSVVDVESRRNEVDQLPARLRLTLMLEHGRLVEGINLEESLDGYNAGRDVIVEEPWLSWYLVPLAMTLPLFLYWTGMPSAILGGFIFTPIALITLFILSATSPVPELPLAYRRALAEQPQDYAEGTRIGFAVTMKNRRMNLVLLGTLTGAALFGLTLHTLSEPVGGVIE